MEQYFFNVRRDETIFEDHVGVWLPELKAVWVWAIKDSLMLIRQGHVDRRKHCYWIEVCDAKRRAVLSFPIGQTTMH